MNYFSWSQEHAADAILDSHQMFVGGFRDRGLVDGVGLNIDCWNFFGVLFFIIPTCIGDFSRAQLQAVR